MFSPTPEQQAIVKAAKEQTASIMIQAYAGCAKTTTLELLAKALPGDPAMALAFNVKIKKELEKRFPPNFTIKTLNGLGHTAWSNAIGRRCQVEERKLGTIVTQVLKAAGRQYDGELWQTVRQLVSSAMLAGIVPSRWPHAKALLADTTSNWLDVADDNYITADENAVELAQAVLIENINQAYAGVISYDDQIYCSALLGGVFPRFNLVLVDEAQDLSVLNHIMVRKSAAGRLIVVGDARQSIYGFRGADHQSMGNLRSLRNEWIDLPLTLTFRCPKLIVERQQAHAPGFTAASANEEGELKVVQTPEKIEDWLQKNQSAGPTVLCRNNAPLLSVAFRLIRRGVGCVMLGRDIGKNLVALSKKILPKDDTPCVECVSKVNQWIVSESDIARVNGKEGKISGIEDRGQCLLAVLESGAESAGDLRKKLEAIFSKEAGAVTLSSIHRAKGLEWPIVVHLDPWRIPSKYARRRGSDSPEMIQEKNLLYVCETRAKKMLVQANLEESA